jgi:uncharacterized protein YkwD
MLPPCCYRMPGRVGEAGNGMTFHQPLVRTGAGLVAAAALALLCACSSDRELPTGEPSFYRSMAASDAQVDAATAASMISGYRTNNGLTPVTVDPELMKMAEAQAQAMASRDKLDHDAISTFRDRLKQGYRARTAAENVGAGYHTLAEAFSGWRDSPPHRANMLLSGATRMGIATAYSPKSKFKVFWALILAEPDDRRG